MAAPWRNTPNMRLVARNERGYRIGETHHRSTISDAIVNRLRDLHEYEKIALRELARMFELPYSTVWDICHYRVRTQLPRDWTPERRSPNGQTDDSHA